MKVVIFCGGLGTRLREHSDTIPKPLVPIGSRPLLWHLMKYYAHFGHKHFILCLGYKGDMIREYFLNYNPNLTRDFCMFGNATRTKPSESDIDDWIIEFVDTGLHSNIGERLVRIRDHLSGDEMFLANYSDQLSDLNLNDYIENFSLTTAVAGFLAVRPSHSFHFVDISNDNSVRDISGVNARDIWINGGFMVLRSAIFDHIREGEELVEEPFHRLISKKKLFAQKHDGFWKAMDTFKDKIQFDRLDAKEHQPWLVW